MSFKWKFYPITENSYSNRINLSVIGKETYKLQHEISSFWDFFSCLRWITEARKCIIYDRNNIKESYLVRFFNKIINLAKPDN